MPKRLHMQVYRDDKDFFEILDVIQKCKNISISNPNKMLSYNRNRNDVVDNEKENELFQIDLLIKDAVSIEHSLEQLQRDFREKLSEQSQRARQLLLTIQTSGVEIVPYK